MNREEQINFFKNLPNDTDPLFSSTITKQINEKSYNESVLIDIMQNETDIKVRFGAYYTLATIYREQRNYSKMEALSSDYEKLFSEKPLFDYIKSAIYKRKLTKTDANLSIQYARDAIIKIEKENSNYPGFYQNFADAVLLALENQLLVNNNQALLNEAETSINHALQINPSYAKYYATLGRIQLQKEEFDEAKKNISKAIDLEDAKSPFHSLKITEYQDLLTRCSLAQTINEVEKNRIKIEQEYIRLRNSIVEFIGFFSAIVAMVISTTTVVVKVNVADSIRILSFLYGGMIIILACLKISLDINIRPLYVILELIVLAISFVGLSFLFSTFL